MTSVDHAGRTLITGATGFLGHVVLAELLRLGHSCAVLVRDAAAAAPRLYDLLAQLGTDSLRSANGRVAFIEGELPRSLPTSLPFRVDRVVHAAACTRFEPNNDGDPFQTNAMGTASLLRWCDRNHIREFHLVSTAYAYGLLDTPVPERVHAHHGQFRNAYEHSKWTAEQFVHVWAQAPGRSYTVSRPSIVVGDYATGHASKLNGLYIALRAFARGVALAHTPSDPLRVEGRAHGNLNFVPVDHVARAIARIVDTREHHGSIYNLVDPCPPENRWLLDELQRFHALHACRFVEPGSLVGCALSHAERVFASAMHSFRGYLDAPCGFDRGNTEKLERGALGPWPCWDRTSIHRMFVASQGVRCMNESLNAPSPLPRNRVIDYFETFLPSQLGGTALAGMSDLTTSFRFTVDGIENASWLCRFQNGRLVGVHRGATDAREDFSYRMDTDAFFDIVGALVDPQEVFLDGRIHIAGNVEQALKMGVLFHQFNREHPYRLGIAPSEVPADA